MTTSKKDEETKRRLSSVAAIPGAVHVRNPPSSELITRPRPANLTKDEETLQGFSKPSPSTISTQPTKEDNCHGSPSSKAQIEKDEETKRRMSATRKAVESSPRAIPPLQLVAPASPCTKLPSAPPSPDVPTIPPPKRPYQSPVLPPSELIIPRSPASTASRESITVAFPKARRVTPPASPIICKASPRRSERTNAVPLMPSTGDMEPRVLGDKKYRQLPPSSASSRSSPHRKLGERKQRVSLPPVAIIMDHESTPGAFPQVHKHRLGDRKQRVSLPPFAAYAKPAPASTETENANENGAIVPGLLGERKQQRASMPPSLPDSPSKHRLGDKKQQRASLPPSFYAAQGLPGAHASNSPPKRRLGDKKQPPSFYAAQGLPGAHASASPPKRRLGDKKQPPSFSRAQGLPGAHASNSPPKHRLGDKKQRLPPSGPSQRAAETRVASVAAVPRHRQLGEKKSSRISLPNTATIQPSHDEMPTSNPGQREAETRVANAAVQRRRQLGEKKSGRVSLPLTAALAARRPSASSTYTDEEEKEEEGAPPLVVPNIAGPGAFFVPADAVDLQDIEGRSTFRRPSTSSVSSLSAARPDVEMQSNYRRPSYTSTTVSSAQGSSRELTLADDSSSNNPTVSNTGTSSFDHGDFDSELGSASVRPIAVYRPPESPSPSRSDRSSRHKRALDVENEDDSKPERRRGIWNAPWWCNFVVPLILVGVVVAVTIVAVKSIKKSSPAARRPPPAVPVLFGVNYTAPNFTLASLEDPNSPQSKASAWLLADPKIHKYNQSRKLTRYALATMFYSTNGQRWENSTNWLSYDHHECLWFSARNITGMQSRNDNTTTPTAKEISCNQNMEYEHLLLDADSVRGPLPPEISLITSLVQISLGSNKVYGTIPTELGGLTKLTRLGLYLNDFEGTLPSQLGLLSNSLQQIDVRDNKLAGTVPTELAQLSGLTDLHLTDNKFNSTIPSVFGQLEQLMTLRLGNNELAGPIPTELGLLKQLNMLNVGGNQLTGTLPTEIASLSQLTFLGFASNAMNTTIPSELAELTALETLLATGAGLYGTIPEQVGRMTRLAAMSFGSNGLTGTIPSTVGQLSNMQFLYFYDNQLTGTLPSELGNLNRLEILHAYVTELNSTIPSQLGSLTLLTDVLLFDTMLSGELPSEFNNLSNLEELGIKNTDLSGGFPNTTCSLVASGQLTLTADCTKMACCNA